MTHEKLSWHCRWTLEKFHEQADGTLELYERRIVDGNLAVTAGIQLLEDLLIGAGGTAYNNANARIGVGDSSTAAAIGQTDLQGGNKTRNAMVATFPSRAASVLSFKSSFASAEANYAWNEWGIFNAASSGTMLNRKVESLGTKSSGNVWTLQADITIA